MNKPVRKDYADITFRVLFSSIFLGLGGEHLFQDELVQKLMPSWFMYKRLLSILAGLVLVTGAASIITGYRLRQAAVMLAGFLVTVTILIHLPELSGSPEGLPEDWVWLWQVFQRSNFVKNLCLLGVCIHLYNYQPGYFTLEGFFMRSRAGSSATSSDDGAH